MTCTALFTTIPMGRATPCAIGVQIQIIVPKQTYIFSPDTSCLGYSIKCQTMEVLEIIWAQRHTASCTFRHYSRWLLGVFCPPKRFHKRARASFDPRLSLISEVGYYIIMSLRRFYRVQGVPKVRSSYFMHYNFWSKLYLYMKLLEGVHFSIKFMYSEFE